jgi:hypothetical protein
VLVELADLKILKIQPAALVALNGLAHPFSPRPRSGPAPRLQFIYHNYRCCPAPAPQGSHHRA